MKAVTLFLVASLTMFSGALAHARQSDAVPNGRSRAIAKSGATAGEVERWRYKRHNGHWWYYQPYKSWLFWNGSSWSPYSSGSYASWFAANHPRVTTGYRGTVRYSRNVLGTSGSGIYTWDPYAPYNTEAMTPSAHLGQAMSGGMGGAAGARTARVGENW